MCTEGEGALPEPARGEAGDYGADLQAPHAGTAGSAIRYSLSDTLKNYMYVVLRFCWYEAIQAVFSFNCVQNLIRKI